MIGSFNVERKEELWAMKKIKTTSWGMRKWKYE